MLNSCLRPAAGAFKPAARAVGRNRVTRSPPSSQSPTVCSAVAMEQQVQLLQPVATTGQQHGSLIVGTLVQAFTIIGGGRIGQAIAQMGPGTDVIIRRDEPISGPPGPILVCTRNDVLDAIVDATPQDRRTDLVFLQNGMLQPWLDSRGLGDNTQVLVYFAVAKLGDAPLDGKTDVNPEGLTAAYGRHAEAVARRLHAGGLSCKVLDRPAFIRAMLEKLVWISAFMLVGAKHKATVGEVECQHSQEVAGLIHELAAAGRQALGVELEPGVVERLMAYARSVAHFPTAVKEFEWRNGYFYGLTQQAAAQGRPDPCPLHTALLQEVGAVA